MHTQATKPLGLPIHSIEFANRYSAVFFFAVRLIRSLPFFMPFNTRLKTLHAITVAASKIKHAAVVTKMINTFTLNSLIPLNKGLLRLLPQSVIFCFLRLLFLP